MHPAAGLDCFHRQTPVSIFGCLRLGLSDLREDPTLVSTQRSEHTLAFQSLPRVPSPARSHSALDNSFLSLQLKGDGLRWFLQCFPGLHPQSYLCPSALNLMGAVLGKAASRLLLSLFEISHTRVYSLYPLDSLQLP